MKKYTWAIVLISVLLTAACSKKEEPPAPKTADGSPALGSPAPGGVDVGQSRPEPEPPKRPSRP